MIEKLPFLPIDFKTSAKLVRFLNPLSSALVRFRPSLEGELSQMEAGFDAATYVSVSVLAGFYGLVMVFLIVLSLLQLAGGANLGSLFAPFIGALIIAGWLPIRRLAKKRRRADMMPTVISVALAYYVFFFVFLLAYNAVLGARTSQMVDVMTFVLPIALGFGLFVFVQSLLYPHVTLGRKMRALNKDMLFALRHLLIQIRSGVPLYNALVSVGEGGYGIISQEFGRTVKEINAGVSQVDALENMAMRNPSIYLRRAIWQIVNALRAGSEVAKVLESLVEQFAAEERVNLGRFGREMGPWALMYLLTTIIFPTMGVAMLLILPTITPIQVSGMVLYFFVLVFAAFQYFFIQLIKSKRPVVHFK